MHPKQLLRNTLAASAALLLAACQDNSPVAPDSGPAFERSERAQENMQDKLDRTSPEVLDLPGTVFAANDARTGKLVFGVEGMQHGGSVKAKLKQLGIDDGEYTLAITPPIVLAKTLRDQFLPVVAGVQINFTQYVCTLGFNVDLGGVRSFITNSHCTANQGGVDNTQYWQPLKSTHPTVIATEVADPVFAKNLGTCSKGKKCRYSDASRARYAAGIATNRGEIARTTGANNGSLDLASETAIFTIDAQENTVTNFAVGTVVNKVGRTTGWTRGSVTQSCANVNVSGTQLQLLCQTLVQDPGGASVVSGGDSGSPVFIAGANNTARLVGILWGGSSDNKLFVFSPLASVQRELGTFTATK